MMDEGMATCAGPSFWWRVSDLPRQVRQWLVGLLLGLLVKSAGDSNLMAHARRELPPDGDDEMQREMNQCVLQVLAVFAAQGHSGFSAGYATSVLQKLMRFEPLSPLTGEDAEWFDYGGGLQNCRRSSVFKGDLDRFGGQAYDINAVVFREANGACFTGRGSAQPVTFPYTPRTIYVDVDDHGKPQDGWNREGIYPGWLQSA